MIKASRSSAVLMFLSGTLALVSFACSSDNASKSGSVQEKPIATASAPSVANSPVAKPTSLPVERNKSTDSTPSAPDTYQQAIYKAARAKSISESAQSREDWKLVSSQWQQVVDLLKAVPPKSANYAIAKTKLKEYQEQLDYAQQQADPRAKAESPVSKCIPKASARVASGTVFRVPIKRREYGTVVIDVTVSNFNIKQTFEMMLDTGASATAITQQMAAALRVDNITVAGVSTAGGKALVGVGCIDSIKVGGASLKNLAVLIPPGLDVGLLGQNFFGGYDVTIKNNFVEFRVR